MNSCDFTAEQLPDSRWRHTCQRPNCGIVVENSSARYFAPCKVQEPVAPVVQDGPGTELHKLFGRLRIKPERGCKCWRRIAEMNARGCGWCRENIDKIVGWLKEEADRRKLSFSATVAVIIVRLAIRRAEKRSVPVTE